MTRRQVIEELEKLKRGEERERKEAKSRENPPFYRSFLRNAPKLKAAEKLPYKKVIAKWFSSSMTWYATEYDPSDGTLFGYVENIGSPFCSEWGYFSIEELEKMAIDRDGAFRHYIDRDPHLSDCWLDIKGNLYSQLPQQAA
jgi:hypothetical protein